MIVTLRAPSSAKIGEVDAVPVIYEIIDHFREPFSDADL